jgi:hypothetical protein
MILISSSPVTGHRSALRGAAAALVGAGAIAADQAWRVIDDYATATHIRSGKPGFVHFGPPLRRRKADSLSPRQARLIDQEILVGEHQVLVRDLPGRSGLKPSVTLVQTAGRFPVECHAPRHH